MDHFLIFPLAIFIIFVFFISCARVIEEKGEEKEAPNDVKNDKLP